MNQKPVGPKKRDKIRMHAPTIFVLALAALLAVAPGAKAEPQVAALPAGVADGKCDATYLSDRAAGSPCEPGVGTLRGKSAAPEQQVGGRMRQAIMQAFFSVFSDQQPNNGGPQQNGRAALMLRR
jgi:hypothetical protein